MQIRLAKNIGFCFGVNRAVETAQKLVRESKRDIYTYGELIHNREVIERLRGEGVIPVDSLDDVPSGNILVIRSHGVPEAVISECKKRGIIVHDATCPFVKKIHDIVRSESRSKQVIIVGTDGHPEVVGIAGNCVGGKAVVVSSVEEAKMLDCDGKNVCVVAQTTCMVSKFVQISETIKKKCNNAIIYDTTCDTTRKRQEEAEKLSRECDRMMVIGDKNSSNTRKLAEICKKNCRKVVTIENSFDIALENIYFDGIIGIVAGASTPDWMIMEVLRMENHDNTMEQSFAELLNEKEEVKLYPGKKVKGRVISVSSEKIDVDLQYKADGVLPAAEYSTPNLHETIKVDDEIEVIVKEKNDGSGQVLLTTKSQERMRVNPIFLDEEQWKDKVFDAVVKEEVKGGLAASVEGSRVFIPASQVSVGYVKELKEYVGKTLQVKIMEVTKGGRSIVASARELLLAELEEKKRSILSTLEVGATIHGTVKRFEKYGAFVDIGGIEGLLPTGDISWIRFKQISDVLSIGQEIDVIILAIDMEKLRISLGYKQLQPKPWSNVEEKYPVGSTVEGKVVRLMTFGAFVELEPSVDALVHISHLAVRRIDKVEDEVSVGDIIRAKVLEVDAQAKRISLSRKEAIIEENPEIAEELAREKEERDRVRAAQREAAEQQRKERQQAMEEERARRNERRDSERAERRSRREEAEYTIPAEERSTTSLASLLQGFKADEE